MLHINLYKLKVMWVCTSIFFTFILLNTAIRVYSSKIVKMSDSYFKPCNMKENYEMLVEIGDLRCLLVFLNIQWQRYRAT